MLSCLHRLLKILFFRPESVSAGFEQSSQMRRQKTLYTEVYKTVYQNKTVRDQLWLLVQNFFLRLAIQSIRYFLSHHVLDVANSSRKGFTSSPLISQNDKNWYLNEKIK